MMMGRGGGRRESGGGSWKRRNGKDGGETFCGQQEDFVRRLLTQQNQNPGTLCKNFVSD